jgi:DNA-binding GntR family transcriptional regulator
MATTGNNQDSPERLVTTTYQKLLDLIVCGRITPGSRIIESDLEPSLGVSRRTIQAVLLRLEQEGVVERLPGRRARWRTTPLTAGGFRELALIMSALDGTAGRCAAELEPAAREELTDDLRSINDQLRAAIDPDRGEALHAANLDEQFHGRIVDAVTGSRFKATHAFQEPLVRVYKHHYATYLMATMSTSADEHIAIIEAIDRGDPDAAERAIRANWKQAAVRYATVMENAGEQGAW